MCNNKFACYAQGQKFDPRAGINNVLVTKSDCLTLVNSVVSGLWKLLVFSHSFFWLISIISLFNLKVQFRNYANYN